MSTLASMSFPWFFGDMVDVAQGNSGSSIIQDRGINGLAGVLVIILIVQAIVSFLGIYFRAKYTEPAIGNLRKDLFSRMIHFPLSYIENQKSGALVSRLAADVSQLYSMMSTVLIEFIRQVLTLVSGLVIMCMISVKLTAVMISTFPVVIVIVALVGRVLKKVSVQRQDAVAESNSVVAESMNSIGVVKAFSGEAFEEKRYRGFINQVVRFGIRRSIFRGFMSTSIVIGIFGGIVLVLWYGSSQIEAGNITSGDLVKFLLYTVFIGGTLAGLGNIWGQVLEAIGASLRLREMMKEPTEAETYSGVSKASTSSNSGGDIDINALEFYYPSRPDMKVLDGIDIKIKEGWKIALVGQSGAGKSTIGLLLMGLYPYEHGSISIGGTRIEDLTLAELRGKIGLVPQEVTLFSGSIMENIRYGNPDASDEEIWEASRQANAAAFIESFPEGMDTLVGERGIKLSGGQKQRIAIARAILKDPEILILDEATSSLDAESESLVQEALELLMEGRTTIIIAHRLTTIRNVDQIHVLLDGKLVEQGTYEELASKPLGVFAGLLKLQFEEK